MKKTTTIVSISLVLVFVVLSVRESSLFKFHPSFMAASYLGFMFQAINIFSTNNSSRSLSLTRRKQIFIHSFLQIGTIICSMIAFTAIYLTKQQRNKEHFTSWHGFLGFIVFLWSLLQAIGGLFLTIFQPYIRSLRLTYTQLRIYHATSGVLVFTFSCFVVVLGLTSNWFKTKMPLNTILYFVIFYLLTSSILFLAHKCVEQVKARYVKERRP